MMYIYVYVIYIHPCLHVSHLSPFIRAACLPEPPKAMLRDVVEALAAPRDGGQPGVEPAGGAEKHHAEGEAVEREGVVEGSKRHLGSLVTRLAPVAAGHLLPRHRHAEIDELHLETKEKKTRSWYMELPPALWWWKGVYLCRVVQYCVV